MRKQLLIILMLMLPAFQVCASRAWLNEMIVSQEKSLYEPLQKQSTENHFFSQHGLVLFYASTCPHCHALAPELKRWSEKNRAEVLALSIDNKPLNEFQNFLPATTEWINAAFNGKPIGYPALFVVNPKTRALYPVATGSMTEMELDARMHELIPKIAEYEKRSGVL